MSCVLPVRAKARCIRLDPIQFNATQSPDGRKLSRFLGWAAAASPYDYPCAPACRCCTSFWRLMSDCSCPRGSCLQLAGAHGYAAQPTPFCLQMLHELLEIGANLHLPATGGVQSNCPTAHSAPPCLQMVHKLLEAGADAKLLDHRGCTALQCAAEGGHAEIFERLLEAGCSALCADDAGVTVLHSAAQGRSLELVEECLDLGADPLATTQLGRSVLHFAAFGGLLAGPNFRCSVSAFLLLMSPKGAAQCHLNAIRC